MPRIVIDYSRGLEDSHDMQALCDHVFGTLSLDPEITPAAIKIQATPVDHWRIGTAAQDFAHATLYIYAGLDAEISQRLTETVLRAMEDHMPEVDSLYVYARELPPTSYATRVKG